MVSCGAGIGLGRCSERVEIPTGPKGIEDYTANMPDSKDHLQPTFVISHKISTLT